MTESVELRALTLDEGRDLYDMLQEMPQDENGFQNGCRGADQEGYRAWLRRCADDDAGVNLPPGHVPMTTYCLTVDGRPVGLGKVRRFLSDTLRRRGGHIGYGIRPGARGKGYGALLLSLLLDEARARGIGETLITVNRENAPSLRTALGNGARLTDTVGDVCLLWAPTALTERLRNVLQTRGAAVTGFGDLRGLPVQQREGYPVGVCVGMPWEREVLRGIGGGPTAAYHANYDDLNGRLDALAVYAEDWLTRRGHRAKAKTRAVVDAESDGRDDRTLLPHKTVATRAGVGWIGKCALLVTPEYGPAVRLSAILTDAPLETADPIDESRCGACAVCQSVCPAGAVSGKLWRAGIPREAFWDAAACRRTARALSMRALGETVTLCGLCILRCPRTRRYLEMEAGDPQREA